MSKPSRLARPVSANITSKLPVSRIEDFNSRSKKSSLGEKIPRAGSEGSLAARKKQQQVRTAQTPIKQPGANNCKGQTKNNTFGGSLDDTECRQSKESLSNGNSPNPSRAGRNIPRRHTVGGPRSSKEILGMQTSDMDRKREAFLEHLKYKYPHHATAIMGHQERLRDQTKSPKLSSSPQPSLGEPAEHLSEVSVDSGEAMFEGESTAPFVRGSRTRASLPVVRSTNQTKERSLGVLFLQYGEDTKKLQMPNEITSVDTIRALFVSAFPQQLTMKVLESPSTAIYIKDEGRNIYYELSDVRNIQDRSFLKVYNKDPAQAFNHTPSAVNGDVRMQRDIAYNVREGPVVHRPGSATYPSHGGPISPPPTPVPHSMPPSPSRIPYGGGRPPVGQSNTTMPRDRLSSLPVSRSISPSPSAILERRDVKPDEDLGNKNVQLIRNDSMYADPYMYHEGRMSIASSHGGHPLDMPDHLIAYHRGAMRSSSTYSNTMQVEMMEQSVYRQKSRKHSDSHLPTLGSKTPPASPHRVTDIRMMEMHGHNAHGPPHGIHSERSSPIRQSFKKDQVPGVFVEAKVRNTGGILGMADIVPSPTDKQMYAAGYGAPKDNYTREKVIRSASSTPPVTDSPGHSASSGKNSLTIIETAAVISQALPVGSTDMQVSLHDMRRNVAELRLQLQKMRQLQLQNQEMVRAMMKKAEQEISSKMTEMVKNLEDPVQRQRVLVEQERQKYLQDEEQIVLKLSDLESFVEDMRKDSSATRVVTLKDVEDRAFVLRQIGEAVSNLKGEFPYLQNKMRAVLRVEVEAVRFLKEEPHKLDSLLKRIRSMTDALSALRRHVSDGSFKTVDYNQNNQYTITEKGTETEVIQNKEEKSQVYLQSALAESGNTTESQTISVNSEVVPLSAGVKVLHVQSSPVLMKQSQHSTALVNLPFTSGNQSSLSADSSANHQSVSTSATLEQNATAPHTQLNGSSAQSLFIEEIQHVGYRNRAVSIEEAERKFEEKRQNLDHYDGKEFEKMLEEAQANIMKSIPSLEMPTQSSKVEIVEKLEVNEGGQESEQENEKVTKSPPPPPPRRMYPLGSSLSSSWTSDWKDSKDAEDVPPPPPPKANKPEVESPIKTYQVKDEEEEEGERIMAELQAFQKCSVVEINSKVHYEPSKPEVHERDFRPSGLALPKEKKVSCLVSKESVSPESPKLVESTEDKWKMQSIPSSAPDFAQFRQPEKVVVNEQSTYSLFIGRDEPRSTVSKEPEKEDKNEELVNMALYRYHNRENLKHLTSTVPEVINGGTDHKISESTSTLVKSFSRESQDSPVGSSPSQEQGMPYFDLGQTVVLRPKNSRRTTSQQSDDLESPTISPTEPRSPADNIAFMITNTEVQVLSTGEVQDIVKRKGGEVQTVNVDSENVKIPSPNSDPQDPVMSTDKKPVIIIFDEPMDIRAAYKRLSTIFEECDDELEKMMSSEAKIDEEEEEEEEEENHKESNAPPPKEERAEETKMVNITENVGKQGQYRFNYPSLAEMKQTMFQDTSVSQGFLTDEEKSDVSDYQDGQRQDAKKKFKFRFPKKQLAALTQAIRTGTKTGKKTLQVVVYEDEEEPDGTVKQHKEAKRFEIERSKSADDNIQLEVPNLEEPDSVSRTDEIRQNTYRTLDSLEQTIKQLESTISGMTPRPGSDLIESKDDNRTLTITPVVAKGSVLADDAKLVVESPSSIPTTARKGSNGAPQTSRMPIPMSSKTRQGSMEKTSKQPKLQEPQRQFRQANGGVKKAGGDIKAASPTLSASKIPALSPNTGKSSSVSAQCNDTANTHNPPVKSHVPVTHSNSAPGRNVNASPSLIRPVHNGTSKLQSPTYSGKGHHLSFSLQNANGRPSPPPPSSSSSATSPPSSSVSPTSLAQSMKSIRTIHTPSFTSYKSQNGSATKMAAPKDSS
ncbi:sickle tail protein homolog isoform X3 [Hyla sarda]|uniref:sickle tail protein homolog isoform X3 n=1 Tax=Hyla sarda TaxID=327740 RepID=UPI0024C44709|nr:sickle tail protein homolog isoform X3 [Hyla sarda]